MLPSFPPSNAPHNSYLRYGVDIFNAGHVHDYEATWPIKAGVATQQDYVNPKGVVHITEGNGGVPGCHGNHQIFNCTNATHLWCRAHANGAGYGRLVAHNATHLTYSHVQNNGGVVTDEFTIVQKRHGPFV